MAPFVDLGRPAGWPAPAVQLLARRGVFLTSVCGLDFCGARALGGSVFLDLGLRQGDTGQQPPAGNHLQPPIANLPAMRIDPRARASPAATFNQLFAESMARSSGMTEAGSPLPRPKLSCHGKGAALQDTIANCRIRLPAALAASCSRPGAQARRLKEYNGEAAWRRCGGLFAMSGTHFCPPGCMVRQAAIAIRSLLRDPTRRAWPATEDARGTVCGPPIVR